uniref:TBC1 domain family member 7 n=1 Tax=Timema monikensis TaxID=170555 RepID=A0A7R9HQQ7_9NEOP|nr:unnamed protein product [Timema monikensis]
MLDDAYTQQKNSQEALEFGLDERNFRSSYYEKVGFRSVEEKKSLEILLKDKPLDKTKLKQFSLRFTVPGIYRSFIWKILLVQCLITAQAAEFTLLGLQKTFRSNFLHCIAFQCKLPPVYPYSICNRGGKDGIVPIHVTSHTFVMQQREQEYKDLHHALQIIGLINDDTPKPQMYLLMWLLETGKLRFDWHAQIESDVNHNFLSIANTVLEMLDNDVEAYWLSKGFIHCVSKFQADVPRLTESIMSLLEKEDNELFRYVRRVCVEESGEGRNSGLQTI